MRIIIATIITLALTAIAAPSASARFTIHDTAGHARPLLTKWSLEIKRHTKLPDADITVATRPAGPIPECRDDRASACYDPPTHTMYLHRGDQMIFNHEMGHVFDQSNFTDAQRDAYRTLRGIDIGTPWFSATDAIFSPGEQFARGYALCAKLGPTMSWDVFTDSDMAYTMTREQHRLTCRLIQLGY